MKALEILKRIYINNPDTRFQRNNIDINFIVHDFSNVNEAIKELEALENRSCDNCKQFAKYENQDFGDCLGMVRTLSDIDTVSKDFCCNKWESE